LWVLPIFVPTAAGSRGKVEVGTWVGTRESGTCSKNRYKAKAGGKSGSFGSKWKFARTEASKL
jgi:hypothetical protein